ncbi:MAG: hypothetical protein LC126_05690 [Bryobacterales bacterium]|nr:hypothetical protein [Bryobacterales bacterium]
MGHWIHSPLNRFLVSACLLAIPAGRSAAQSGLIQPATQEVTNQNGWRLYSASASFGYSTLALPVSYMPTYSLQQLQGDFDGIASASFGYNFTGSKGSFSLLYSPSVVGRVRYSNLSSYNQSLNMRGSIHVAPRWDLSVNLSGNDSTLDQLLFSPAILSPATSPVTTLGDLIQSFRVNQYTNDQLASILTGTPYVLTPSRNILYGTRFFTSTLTTGLDYRHTPRLSFHFSAGATRAQTRNNTDVQGQLNFLIPRTTSEQANFSVDYSLSPRTRIGAQVNSSHVDSSLGRYVISTTSLLLNHNLSPAWSVGVSAGPGYAAVLRVDPRYTTGQPAGLGYIAQANTSYTRGEHSLTISYNRMVSDNYGFQSQSSHTIAGTWQWNRPGRSWGLFAGGGLQKIIGGVLGDFQTAYANGGIVRSLTPQLSMNCTYGYVNRQTANIFDLAQQNLNGSSVRVTLMWSPQPQREVARPAPGVGGAGVSGPAR